MKMKWTDLLVTGSFVMLAGGCGTKIVTGDTSMGGAGGATKSYGMATVPLTGSADGEINGTCELVLPNRSVRTCEEISLFIRSPADGEERRAEYSGSKFKFTGLNKSSYGFGAASSKYELQTNVKNEVTPGQTLKIRILAKPRS